MVLHEAARFDAARLVVIAFGGRRAAMTEQACGDANMCRVVDRNAGGSAIPKQVWIDGLARSFERACNDAVIDTIVGHRRAVH